MPGAKAFVPRRWPSAEQAIGLIHEAGGVAVIAHPYWDISEPGEVDDLIRSLGADGVETFYPTHSEEQTKHLLELCAELDLVPTASSDYHGPTHKTFAKFGAYETYGLGEPQASRRKAPEVRTSWPRCGASCERALGEQPEDLADGLLEVRRGHQVRGSSAPRRASRRRSGP